MQDTLIAEAATASPHPPPYSPHPNPLDPRSGGGLFSVEVCPNRPLDATALALIAPKMCSVTWHAQNVVEGMATVRLAGELRRQGHEVLLHVAGRNLSEAQAVEVLEAARSVGIRNLLVLQGDPSPHPERDDAKCDFPHASHLVKFIRAKYDRYFVIGVAGYPEKHPQSANLEQDIAYLKKKVSCGADFIITQACFSFEAISTFARACRSEGIEVPIVAGLFVFGSWAALRTASDRCGFQVPRNVRRAVEDIGEDDEEAVREFGSSLAARLAAEILSSEGASLLQGFHAFTLNDLELFAEVLRKLGLKTAKSDTADDGARTIT